MMSFSEMRQKDVINIRDGRNLGKPIDLILNENACIQSLVVPGESGGFLGMFKANRDGFVIDWRNVRRIGDDVILVDLDSGHCEP